MRKKVLSMISFHFAWRIFKMRLLFLANTNFKYFEVFNFGYCDENFAILALSSDEEFALVIITFYPQFLAKISWNSFARFQIKPNEYFM